MSLTIQNDQERGWIIHRWRGEQTAFSDDPETLSRLRIICPFGCHSDGVAADDTGSRYETISLINCRRCISLPYAARSDAEREDWHNILVNATGVFFTGGNQLRISTVLGGTRVAQTIRRMNAQGVPVGGTSAGAAILPEHMIAYGNTGGTPRAGMVSLAPGLGLTNRFVIDQHFRERD